MAPATGRPHGPLGHCSLSPLTHSSDSEVGADFNQPHERRVHWLPTCARSEAIELGKIRTFWSSKHSSNYFWLPGLCPGLCRDQLPFYDPPVRYALSSPKYSACSSVRVSGAVHTIPWASCRHPACPQTPGKYNVYSLRGETN